VILKKNWIVIGLVDTALSTFQTAQARTINTPEQFSLITLQRHIFVNKRGA